MPAVTLDNVSFCYGDLPIIQEAHVEVEEGECIGLIGPNGGGKTTLLKLIMGLLQPHCGQVRLFENLPKSRWGEIGYVPQSMPFDRAFPLTLLEFVLEGTLCKARWGGGYSQTHQAMAEEALERVGLTKLAKRSLHALSGGELQRGLIARAVVLKPRLLILDEPTANVDAETEASIYKLLKNLQATILMVTHNLHIAIHQVDRVLCVQTRVTPLKTEEVCEHFAMGLYQTPLLEKNP